MTLRSLVVGIFSCMVLAGCQSVDLDDERIPRSPVYVPFTTESEWHLYVIGGYMGEGGAMQARRFIRSERVPSNYQYPDYSYTGYGGLLLTCDALSQLHVFDLSCPVERQPSVRISIGQDLMAHCAKCGSSFDVYGIERTAGSPAGGVALSNGYSLRAYRIVFGVDGRYALLTR